ncbi:MAG TPA: LysE family translocator [Burkholderiaceae bacterium]|nr:LysE family translocator [Burkholderiaceae bacterium]
MTFTGSWLPSWPLLAAFLAASLVLAVTPGPGVFYIVTRTLAQGRRAGLASVGGVAAGNLANGIAAIAGLAAVFAVSAFAFTVVKFAGAAYLIILGVRALRHADAAPPPARFDRSPPWKILRDGFFVALLNPKTAIFFAAFLPQFIPPGADPGRQGIALAAIFVALAATTDCAYALAASRIAPRLLAWRGARRAGRLLTATAFIGLGVFTAAGSHRPR